MIVIHRCQCLLDIHRLLLVQFYTVSKKNCLLVVSHVVVGHCNKTSYGVKI